MNVLEVRQWEKDGDPKTRRWYVTLEGRSENVPCYDAAAADLKIGEPLPGGWEVTQSKAGKDYIKTPQSRGGGRPPQAPSYRNTAEGFAAEQDSIHRSVALNAAVALAGHSGVHASGAILANANSFHEWLKAAAPPVPPKGDASKGSSGTAGGVPGTPPVSSSASGEASTKGRASSDAGSSLGGAEVPTGSLASVPSDHIHEFKPHPRLKKLDMCACGETRRKAEA